MNDSPEFITRLKAKAKKQIILSIAVTVGFVVCLGVLCARGAQNAPAFMGLLMAVLGIAALFAWIFSIRYIVAGINFRWFLKNGSTEMLRDVDAELAESPKSDIVCGDSVLVQMDPVAVMIPYTKIKWIYLSRARGKNGLGSEQGHIYTKDGKHFVLASMYSSLFDTVVREHIIPQNPDAVVGYGKDEKKEAEKGCGKLADAAKRRKIVLFGSLAVSVVCGIICLAMGKAAPGIVELLLCAGLIVFFLTLMMMTQK